MPPFLHLLPNAWFFLGGFHRHRRILRRILRRRASGVEVSFLRKPLMGSSGRNLFRGPLSGPSNPVIPYPVVRLTFKAPVPDRRVERNRLAVKNELPIRGTERRNDLFSASAATLVDHGRVFHRHVERPLLHNIGDEFDE